MYSLYPNIVTVDEPGAVHVTPIDVDVLDPVVTVGADSEVGTAEAY